MIIKTFTATTYDISQENSTKKLITNINNYHRRNQIDALIIVMDQVLPYEFYDGTDNVYINARKVCNKLRVFLPDIPAFIPQIVPELLAVPAQLQIQNIPLPLVEEEPPQNLLYIPEMKTGTIYVISMAPINSSGDIYHIIAWLLILIEYHKQPAITIQLNYDKPTSTAQKKPSNSTLSVGDQVKRSTDFANTLGLGGYFTTVELPFNQTGREKVREKEVQKYFLNKSQKQDICYIDQMATTVLVAGHVLEHGYEQTTQIIDRGFSCRDPHYFIAEAQNEIDTYVAEVIGQLTQEQPLVVLHIRYSSKANEQLNLPDDFISMFAKTLQGKNYQVCMVLADDRKGKSDYKSSNSSLVLTEPFKGNRFFIGEVDYGKQAHLQLLRGLKLHQNHTRVIGNTSGTLDLAAFIGLATYSIHQFTNTGISYQECRLAFQMLFLSIGALLKDPILKAEHTLNPEFETWLTNPATRHGVEQFLTQTDSPRETVRAQKASASYSKMFSLALFSKGKGRTIPLPKAEEVILECLYT